MASFAGWRLATDGDTWIYSRARAEDKDPAGRADVAMLTGLSPFANRALLMAHHLRGERIGGMLEGRFLAAYGPAAGKQRVLWVDYETAVSIHPLAENSAPQEKRKARLASPDAEDNRITHGCINVSQTFYNMVVKPTFEKGGVSYVLPDTKTVQTAFPGYDPRIFVASATEANKTANASLVAP